MRIGIDAHAAERDGSGNCTYIRGLISGLAEIDDRNDYFLYTLDEGHPFYGKLVKKVNFHLRTLGTKNPLFRIPFSLATKTYTDRLDILHVQYIAPPIHRGRLIVTIHDLAFLHVPESFARIERFRSRLLFPSNARRAKRIICGSQYSRADIARRYGVDKEKIEVTPYSAPASYRPVAADDARLKGVLRKYGINGKFIFTLGRMNPRKNLKTLIRVYTNIRANLGIKVKLVVGGKKDLFSEDVFHQVEKSGYGEDIIFTGFIHEADLPFLYSVAEVFVYPSLFEGFGLPPLEALACGCPVVTSNVSSLPEVVGDAALLVDPNNEEGLREAIAAVISDDDLRNDMKRRGQARAGRFSWKATAVKTLEVYMTVGGQENTTQG